MIRKPCVAGQFYPGSKEALTQAVKEYLSSSAKPKKVIGVIAPHAGYIYSGATAGRTFASACVPKRCIILGPNHSGLGARAAIMADGEWQTPLGSTKIDNTLASELIKNCAFLEDDAVAHVREHSLEVELPFLQARQEDFLIVPICLRRLSRGECEELGRAIAGVIEKIKDDVLIVASTDMNHYESQERTLKKDEMAIKEILSLNPDVLLTVCAENDITMCGVIPTAVLLYAAKALQAKTAELVEHTTSGDTSGDYDAVVGYAGFLVY